MQRLVIVTDGAVAILLLFNVNVDTSWSAMLSSGFNCHIHISDEC